MPEVGFGTGAARGLLTGWMDRSGGMTRVCGLPQQVTLTNGDYVSYVRARDGTLLGVSTLRSKNTATCFPTAGNLQENSRPKSGRLFFCVNTL